MPLGMGNQETGVVLTWLTLHLYRLAGNQTAIESSVATHVAPLIR